MHQSTRQGAAISQRPITRALERISWDDLRMFVIAAREQSFRKAAITLKTSSSTVTRRIERLERNLGLRLFDRVPEGVRLTLDGGVIFEESRRMEEVTLRLRRHIDRDLTSRGRVRCTITEGLGTFWMMPRLAEFHRANPFTSVDLRCTMNFADVLRLESDMAIQLAKPEASDLKVVRIGRLHVCLFAAPRYLDLYGPPERASDLVHHRLVEQVSPQLPDGILAKLIGLPSVEGAVALRTNLSSAHFHAIETGIGIGLLPTYAIPLGANVVPLDLGVYRPVDIWLTYHPDVREIPRVNLFMDWVRSIFDARRYPWFADEFIHPNELSGWMAKRPGPPVPFAEGVIAHPQKVAL